MKLTLSGPLSINIAQSLCQLYFPTEKFGNSATTDPSASFDIAEVEGEIRAVVGISHGGKSATAQATFPISPLYTHKASVRIASGKAFLAAAQQLFGFAPPWGMLTGIRSSKVALDLLARTSCEGETRRRLEADYHVTTHKADLLMQTALHEMQVLHRHGEDTCALYVSVPFCPTRCSYCSFVSYATPRLLSLLPEYLVRLEEDIARMGEVIRRRGKRVSSVYIGGGTPGILTAEQLARLLRSIRAVAPDTAELTLEAGRPDTITAEKMRAAREGGATRVCVNPQSTNDDTLRRIGRSHTAADFFRAMEIVREAGIASVNADIIAGLPGEDSATFRQTVADVLSTRPHSVTVHTFCVKKASYEAEREQNLQAAAQQVAKCVDYARETLVAEGLMPYYMYRQKKTAGNLENVGFALAGHDCAYNAIIMSDAREIYAVGAGAVTKTLEDGVVKRQFMPKYPYEYLGGK
ncbi:MAG: coproporphyrinogen dehydrogenase HemZ [Oscillospiraceae bacterium]|nr:coproporphyrinogen dehydrogenase HemZ [Oscillospiraceae bacterium]